MGESLTCSSELLLLTALSTAAFAPSVAVNHRSLKMSQQDESHLRLQTAEMSLGFYRFRLASK